tara:strand:- start:1861 stop:2028 length:168 start_codon:yes stop_codon:yes gene_type:complete
MISEVNKRLNREYPKLLHAVRLGSELSQETKKAIVYKFIETLEDLQKALNDKTER